ncbi:MAG: DUF934 domain-containing protein [Burkholderiaceae bacterium]|jgi:uncharacterized protein (DUF934 family)
MEFNHHSDTHSHSLLAASLAITNDTNVAELDLQGVTSIALHFPTFSDGRAYSQAQHLRVRRHYRGHLLASGDVLVDQLAHMHRLGFSHALLRDDQDLQAAQRALTSFAAFYQGDTHQVKPLFARAHQGETA